MPAYLRGKSAAEVAALMQGLVDTMTRGTNQIPQQGPPQLPNDDEFITGGQMRQQLNTAQEQALNQVNPWLRSVADQQATFGYNMAKREDPEFFKKYEPEILSALNRVPRQNWTLDVIGEAVNLIKGRHVNEIVAEKARQLEATLDSAMRSTGRAGLGSASQPTETVASGLAKAPEEWRARAKAVGITEDQIREFCWANETTPEAFFKQFGPGLVSDAVAELNFGGKITL